MMGGHLYIEPSRGGGWTMEEAKGSGQEGPNPNGERICTVVGSTGHRTPLRPPDELTASLSGEPLRYTFSLPLTNLFWHINSSQLGSVNPSLINIISSAKSDTHLLAVVVAACGLCACSGNEFRHMHGFRPCVTLFCSVCLFIIVCVWFGIGQEEHCKVCGYGDGWKNLWLQLSAFGV